ncbi:MAG: uncharacterized membrane protein (UPF0127 family) [Flavobacteriaceae bacterium]|jgi:uncharacterized membrane protein (UPF0127 family)|uniref:DUF192 domain-containing protein n=1 Tax=Candidatus Marifrigoribacter sp. Uisw_064 TaxID=3230970 RepID=UPI003AE97DE7
MRRIIYTIAIIGTTILFTNCVEKKETKVLTKIVSFKKEGDLKLLKAESDSLLVTLQIEIADNEYETQTGLMYRKSMEDNHAMLFIFEDEIRRSFYMKNTEFALDIIFINMDKEIVSIQKNAQPLDYTSLPSDAPTMYVLEVNAGLSDQWGIAPGDTIEWTTN